MSGIGCAGRFAYYMDTYGMHGIHGRAPALATGLAAARDDLSIWIVTGDGDALSIGGNHLIHALRRNVPLKILMFNNQIYGLTKGQASPTSELGKVTKSTPFGAQDEPFNPLALALGAGATFAARTVDRDRHHMTDVLRAAARAQGHGVRRDLPELPGVQRRRLLRADGEGPRGRSTASRSCRASRSASGLTANTAWRAPPTAASRSSPAIATTSSSTTPTATTRRRRSRSPASADSPNEPTPIGVFRAVERPVGLTEVSRKLAAARESIGPGALGELLHAGDTWTVS